MNLTLGVIIDGFSGYKPIVHKINNTKAQIRGFHYYSTEFTETDPEYLYVINAEKIGKNFSENCPKHIIISGHIPDGLTEKPDTLIQIQKNIPVETIIQTGDEFFAGYDAWYNSLLMAVINHKSIGDFLNIAAKMMVNPILVMNNNFGIIGTAGAILGSTKGTIWEKVNVPGFVLENFYTPEEIRKISSHLAQKSEQIIDLHPMNDPAHFTLGINILIDGKLYGTIGTVDMNKPFTEGQKEILAIIAQVLKLYFQNHSIYMRIAEDKANWLDSLLDGVDVPMEIISDYLNKYQWKLDDHFCIVTFTTSSDIKIPIISILDIKHINELFPDALISVYEESIVIVIQCVDKQNLNGKRKQQLEQLLKRDIILRCGVSMVFNNFLHLHYYYAQSKFAAVQCKPPINPAICFYEEYQAEHVLQTLSLGDDPRCFCHPGILSFWESGSESQRELVHCLYHYFLNGRNLSSTADAIKIHRNTLIYRLA
ncbi:MAG: helix-turn-helix domain-containing protein, partial [Spirochaetes bacterium]|nr:helix-turn-helix domain-containing protein [Spirochaetota bacterium]